MSPPKSIEFRRRWRRPMTAVVLAAVVLTAMANPAAADPQTNLLNKGCSLYNATNLSNFYTNLNNTFSDLRSQLFGANTKFATAHQAIGSDPVYSMAQCRDYLSTADCVACFDTAAVQIRNCTGANGARVVYDGCFLRTFKEQECHNWRDCWRWRMPFAYNWTDFMVSLSPIKICSSKR